MRRFELHRDDDETGVSGTGVVCQGVEFDDGTCALHWIVGQHRTHSIYASAKTVIDLHGHGGRTRIVWIDGPDGNQRAATPAAWSGQAGIGNGAGVTLHVPGPTP